MRTTKEHFSVFIMLAEAEEAAEQTECGGIELALRNLLSLISWSWLSVSLCLRFEIRWFPGPLPFFCFVYVFVFLSLRRVGVAETHGFLGNIHKTCYRM